MYCEAWVPASRLPRHPLATFVQSTRNHWPGMASPRVAQASACDVIVRIVPPGDSDQSYVPVSPCVQPSVVSLVTSWRRPAVGAEAAETSCGVPERLSFGKVS